MSMEATSGKNPVNHIGKIYNLLSTDIAEPSSPTSMASDRSRCACSHRSGRRLTSPTLLTRRSSPKTALRSAMSNQTFGHDDDELADVTDITRQVIEGDLSTF